ncbi:MAG: HAD family phosphatase [Calditrichia bacterium]
MKALLFDFDGVLVKSMEDHYECWRRTLLEYGIEMVPEELYMLEGQGVHQVASELIRKFRLPVTETPSIVQKKQNYYNELKRIEFYPHLLDTLNWGKEKGLKMAVVTGGLRSRVSETLEEFGLLKYFNGVVTSDDVEATKPFPHPYLKGAEILGVAPADCIVIENAPLGIRSGKAAGMMVIAITTTLSPQFLREADIIVYDFKDLLKALKKQY